MAKYRNNADDNAMCFSRLLNSFMAKYRCEGHKDFPVLAAY